VFGHNIEAFGTRLHAALDNTGVPVERYEYTAQGQPSIFPVAAGSAARPTSSFGNRLLLAGHPWLSNIESYSMGFRLYRPEWSRFLTADPLGMIDGPNRFAYAGMSPIEYMDPWGLDKRKQVFGCVTRGVLGFHRTYCGTMSQADWDRDSANTRTIVSQQTIENSRTSLGGAIGAGVWMAVSDDPNEILAASEVGAVLSNAGGAGLAIHATRTQNMRIQAIRPAKAPTAEYTVYEELPRPVPVLLPAGGDSAMGPARHGDFHGPWRQTPGPGGPPGHGSWGDYLEANGGGRIPSRDVMPNPHAHHSIQRVGRGAQRPLLERIHEVFRRRAGIDLNYDMDNLAWNSLGGGNHSTRVVQDQLSRVEALDAANGTPDQFRDLLRQFTLEATARTRAIPR
jgi:RHS repeat-associated protein